MPDDTIHSSTSSGSGANAGGYEAGAPASKPSEPLVTVLEQRVRVALGRGLGAGSASGWRPPGAMGSDGVRRLPMSPSIRDFLTDGSVPALCDELARLTGVPIWLRDRDGHVITPPTAPTATGDTHFGSITGSGSGGSGGGGGGPRWSIVDEGAGARRAFELVGRAYHAGASTFSAVLRISTGTLGEFVTSLDPGTSRTGASLSEDEVKALRRALTLLASSVSEVCEAQAAVWHRVHELEALYRLSSVLAQAGDVDELLTIALDLAIDALHVDAGSIGVIEPESDQLTMKAARGVSREWMTSTTNLSPNAALRQAALRGEVVTVEDMRTDPRILVKHLVEQESLKSMMSTGMLYHSRPIGLIRLYTRTPRIFTDVEQALLKSIADQSAAAIMNARLRTLREEDTRIQRQVRLAADVQRRMLPRATPNVPRLDVAAKYSPSFELGGDFYDFVELGSSFGIVIGDVAGKGVAAALLMSAVRASLRAHAQDVYDIGEVLVRVNAALTRDTRDNEFATLWYGVVDTHSLNLTYCGAGHEWPLLIHVPRDRTIEESDIERLTADGMALGIDDSQRYPHGTVQLRPGDVLVAFTDGLTDSTDFEQHRFGGTRLRKSLLSFLAKEPGASAAAIVEHVFWQLRQFSGLNRRVDDVTLVVLRVRE
ncbi:MAG: PP2C family protein-serine/threonine phosphatase [Phycisphaerales bacterium]